jgi:hypothetical protein
MCIRWRVKTAIKRSKGLVSFKNVYEGYKRSVSLQGDDE